LPKFTHFCLHFRPFLFIFKGIKHFMRKNHEL
jgi:hypothetical protein